MKKTFIAVSFALAMLSNGSATADTVYCVNCTNEATDMMRQIQNFAQYQQQTQNLINQLEVMRTQAARLNANTPFSQTSNLLRGLMGIVNQGQALGYDIGNITKKFETQYPGFKTQGSYYDNYGNWSKTTSDSIRSALMSAGLQMGNFETESATSDTLRTMNHSATGQMQAIQIGNAVSSEMLDEMRKLRQLNTSQMQAQNAYLLNQQQKNDSQQAQVKTFIDQEQINPKLIKNMK
ncbi:MAG: P-type conjugative transfer protein TrbJ [Methylococcales bacterium]|nr:P-type conjugative transfer protein TrbJ [Methylococcales bacterium]